MKDKLIFDALARPGDDYMKDFYWICQIPGDAWLVFGWIMERLEEWERHGEFIGWLAGGCVIGGSGEVIDYTIPFKTLNPTAMRDALIKFIEGE